MRSSVRSGVGAPDGGHAARFALAGARRLLADSRRLVRLFQHGRRAGSGRRLDHGRRHRGRPRRCRDRPVDAASAAIDADATVEASDAETRVCDYTLANPACWQAFDIGGATSLQTGIFGGAFDGRYVYYANTQGTQVRVDTTVGFGASGSIATYNAGLGGPSLMRTPGFDGRYLYFPHLYGTTISRYDSLDGGFRSGSAWTTVVAPGPAGVDAAAVAAGYLGAIFDGRYMYFALQDSSGLVARYDTTADLDGSASWASFATSALSATSGSLRGGTFDGRYVYSRRTYRSRRMEGPARLPAR